MQLEVLWTVPFQTQLNRITLSWRIRISLSWKYQSLNWHQEQRKAKWMKQLQMNLKSKRRFSWMSQHTTIREEWMDSKTMTSLCSRTMSRLYWELRSKMIGSSTWTLETWCTFSQWASKSLTYILTTAMSLAEMQCLRKSSFSQSPTSVLALSSGSWVHRVQRNLQWNLLKMFTEKSLILIKSM